MNAAERAFLQAADTKDGTQAVPYAAHLDTFRPSYPPAEWETLIPPAKMNRAQVSERMAVSETIPFMQEIVAKSSWQVRDVARLLKAKSNSQSRYNVWHWIKTNVKYKLDTPGIEELRDPARSWADRFDGVDCDDFAIMAASLLKEMGIPCFFKVVGFREKGKFGHVYVVSGREIIDPVMHLFNREPDNISKYSPKPMLENAILPISDSYPAGAVGTDLTGMDSSDGLIVGFGAVATASEVTADLQRRLSHALAEFERAGGAPSAPEPLKRNVRLLTAAVKFNGDATAQKNFLLVLDFLKDITPEGNLVFWDDQAQEEAAAVMQATAIQGACLAALGRGEDPDGIELGAIDPMEAETLLSEANDLLYGPDGLLVDYGLSGRKERVAKRKARRKERRKKIGKFFKKVGAGLKKVVQGFNLINPGTAVMRGAFMAVLAANLFKMGEKARMMWLSDEEARVMKVSPERLKKLRAGKKDFMKKWEWFGGVTKRARKRLEKAIKKGSQNKDRFKPLKAAKVKPGLGATDGTVTLADILQEGGTGAVMLSGFFTINNPPAWQRRPTYVASQGFNTFDQPDKRFKLGIGGVDDEDDDVSGVFAEDDMGSLGLEPTTLSAIAASAAAIIGAMIPIIKKATGEEVDESETVPQETVAVEADEDDGEDEETDGLGGLGAVDSDGQPVLNYPTAMALKTNCNCHRLPKSVQYAYGVGAYETDPNEGLDGGPDEPVDGLADISPSYRMRMLRAYPLMSAKARLGLHREFNDMPLTVQGAVLELAGLESGETDEDGLGKRKKKGAKKPKKAAKKAAKAAKKGSKKQRKAAKKAEKSAKKTAKKAAKQEARSGGGGTMPEPPQLEPFDPEVDEPADVPIVDESGQAAIERRKAAVRRAAGLLPAAGQAASQMMNAFVTPQGQGFQNNAEMDAAQSADAYFVPNPNAVPKEEKGGFFSKKNMPWILGGGAVAVLGIGWWLTRPKKNGPQ